MTPHEHRCPCCGEDTDELVFVPGLEWVELGELTPPRDVRRQAQDADRERRDRRRRQRAARKRNRR